VVILEDLPHAGADRGESEIDAGLQIEQYTLAVQILEQHVIVQANTRIKRYAHGS